MRSKMNDAAHVVVCGTLIIKCVGKSIVECKDLYPTIKWLHGKGDAPDHIVTTATCIHR